MEAARGYEIIGRVRSGEGRGRPLLALPLPFTHLTRPQHEMLHAQRFSSALAGKVSHGPEDCTITVCRSRDEGASGGGLGGGFRFVRLNPGGSLIPRGMEYWRVVSRWPVDYAQGKKNGIAWKAAGHIKPPGARHAKGC